MAIPAYTKILRPVLEFIARHPDQELNITRDLMPAIAEQLNLTEEEKNYRNPSGNLKFGVFIIRAGVDFDKAGLVEKPQRGYVRITQAGQDYLDRYPGEISKTDLRNNCPKYKEWEDGRKKSKAASYLQDTKSRASSVEKTPEERIEDARQEIYSVLKEERRHIVAIPKYPKILRTVLEFLARHPDQVLHITRDLVHAIAKQLNLTEEEKNYRRPSGRLKFWDSIIWACIDFNKAGLIEKPERGYVRITQAGQDYLNIYPGEISRTDLSNNCPKYKKWAEGWKKSKADSYLQDTKNSASSIEETPEARIKDARQEIHPVLKEEKRYMVTTLTRPKILRPVLECLAKHPDQSLNITRDLVPAVAERLNLTEEEKNFRHPSGNLKLGTFIIQAGIDLNKAGLIEKPTRGYFRITQAGQDYLNSYPGRISKADLRNNCPKYKQWKESRKKSKSDSDLQGTKDSDGNVEKTPEERGLKMYAKKFIRFLRKSYWKQS